MKSNLSLFGFSSLEIECKHTLYMSLATRPHYLRTQDSKTHTGLYRRGDILITPANTSLFVRRKGEEHCLQIRLKAEFTRNATREMLNELQQGALSNRLYVKSLSNILAVHLLRQHATTKPHLPTYEGGCRNVSYGKCWII